MNFKQTAAFLAASTLLLSVAGCGKVPGMAQGASKVGMSYNAAAKRKAEKNGSWTVLIHLAGENNLYRFALEDLNEMEAGIPEAGNVNVYVLFDGIKDGDSCVYKIKRDPGGMNTTIVSEKVANKNNQEQKTNKGKSKKKRTNTREKKGEKKEIKKGENKK